MVHGLDRGCPALPPPPPPALPRMLPGGNPAARGRLNAEELPYSAIEARGASMYRGVRGKQAMAGTNQHSDGAAPIPTLQRLEKRTA